MYKPANNSTPRETSKAFFKRRLRDKQNLLETTLGRQAEPSSPTAFF